MSFEAMQAAQGAGTLLGGILQGAAETRAAREQMQLSIQRAGIGAGRAAFAGPLERFQLRQVADSQSRARRQDLAQSVASQRASFASSGVVGGRSQRLFEARSQAAFTRNQALADQQSRLQILASEERQRAALQDARLSMTDAGRIQTAQGNQTNVNLVNTILNSASQAFGMGG